MSIKILIILNSIGVKAIIKWNFTNRIKTSPEEVAAAEVAAAEEAAAEAAEEEAAAAEAAAAVEEDGILDWIFFPFTFSSEYLNINFKSLGPVGFGHLVIFFSVIIRFRTLERVVH